MPADEVLTLKCVCEVQMKVCLNDRNFSALQLNFRGLLRFKDHRNFLELLDLRRIEVFHG